MSARTITRQDVVTLAFGGVTGAMVGTLAIHGQWWGAAGFALAVVSNCRTAAREGALRYWRERAAR